MSDLPILVAARCWAFPNLMVRVDGDLPTVRDPDGCMVDGKMLYRRPLRVGDRVTLAYWPEHWQIRTAGAQPKRFATATVATMVKDLGENWVYYITVTDVQPREETS